TVYIGNAIGLLVPTHKVERGMVFPDGLDHYKLYRVLDFGNVPNAVVRLRDQWGADEARLPGASGPRGPRGQAAWDQDLSHPERTRPPSDLRHDPAHRSADGPAAKSDQERAREGPAQRDAGGPQHQARVAAGGRRVRRPVGREGNPAGRD